MKVQSLNLLIPRILKQFHSSKEVPVKILFRANMLHYLLKTGKAELIQRSEGVTILGLPFELNAPIDKPFEIEY